MLPTRYVPGQSSAARKSRIEGKPSLLPKPRRPGSTDRLSSETRRPSAAGHRSSSAEPARANFGGRLSREASATKLQFSGRARSQTGEAKYGQASMTPLRSSHYSRPTITPVRMPSEDRATRSWQTSLERALAFVTVKDNRPISNVAWQRTECARVQEALAARGSNGGTGAVLIRPLTIARFVDIVGSLLASITQDTKLNNDNYVTKLPHISKRLLYPGAVSKSWLKTVNTLHAFPHALALIAYLLDLVTCIERPVSDDTLYVEKDELACLRRDYLYKCWIRFQDTDNQFEDLNEEYLQSLKVLLGNDEEKIAELLQIIQKYESCLEDEVELAARADEARRKERRDALQIAVKSERGARREATLRIQALHTTREELNEALKMITAETERAVAESQQLRIEVEQQPVTVEERNKLLDEVDYAMRVQDSKRVLAEQISKMLLSKETELALWQNKTLDSCVEFKQGLIHLSAEFPHLAMLAFDEQQLMESECSGHVSNAVTTLQNLSSELSTRKANLAKSRNAMARHKAQQAEETRARITELQSLIQREQQALDKELLKENADSTHWAREESEIMTKLETLRSRQEEYKTVESELEFWEKQDEAWRSKLSSMREFIQEQKEDSQKLLETARVKRTNLVLEYVKKWNQAVGDA